MCGKHYERWRKHGDPMVLGKPGSPGLKGERNPRWAGDSIGYHGAHLRVSAERGKASTHTCEHCGGQAQEWAYDHKDADELIGTIKSGTAPYSLKAEHYFPLCVPCHRVFDQGCLV